jgi:hypothetical protein
MTPNNRQQVLGIIAIAAVAILVADHLLFTPLLASWKARSAQISQLKKSVADGTRLLVRDTAIREHWERMRTNTLSGEPSIAEGEVLRSLGRWEQDSRVSVTSVGTRSKQNADDYATLECQLAGSGSLSVLTRFLYEIEKDPLGLRLDSVDLATQDDRGAHLTLGLQVSGLELNPPHMR